MHRGRGDNYNVGAAGQGHVIVGKLGAGVIGIGNYFPVGDAAERQGRNEPGGAIAHNYVHQRPGLHQLTSQINGLVTGNTASNAQNNVLISQRCSQNSSSIKN